MFIAELPAVLLRRWYVALLGMALTGLALGGINAVVEPKYVATAEILLLPPATVVPPGGNPYLTLGGLSAAGEVMSRAMTDPQSLRVLKTSGLEGEVAVGLDPNAAAPIVLVSVEASSNQTALRGVGLLLDDAPRTLRRIQDEANVRSGSYITTTLVTRDPKAERQIKSLVRIMVLVGVLGIAFTVAGASWTDARMLRRAARKRQRPTPPLENRPPRHGGATGHDEPTPPAAATSLSREPADTVMHGPG